MTNDAFVRHYTAVADASPVPVLLYNFTAVTGVNLLPAAVRALATHPNIVGMKESGGDVAQIADLVSATPDDFSVLAGAAATFYPTLCVGAAGGILALASVLPDAVRAAVRADARPAATTRRSRCSASSCRWRGCSAASTASPGLKAALNLLGYDVGAAASAARSAARGGHRRAARRARAVRGNPRMSLLPDTDRILLGPGPSLTVAARDARDGGADRQPPRSADDARCSTTCARGWRACSARRRVVRVRGVGHRHVRDGNGGREPGQARARAPPSSSPATSAIGSRRCASATARR